MGTRQEERTEPTAEPAADPEAAGPADESHLPADGRPTYGFDTRLELLDHMERTQARFWRTPLEDRNFEREMMGLAPLTEEEIVREIREPERRRGRQIGIKLSTQDYSSLVDAADLFGARPTTMARLNRAVAAVLSFERERSGDPATGPGSRRSGSAP